MEFKEILFTCENPGNFRILLEKPVAFVKLIFKEVPGIVQKLTLVKLSFLKALRL